MKTPCRQKLFYTVAILCLQLVSAHAQQGFRPPGLDVVPPSPGSLQLQRTEDVSGQTGAAQYSLELMTIQDRDIKYPITLTYTGGNGIKVEEMASWVGLGWRLQAPLSLSRTKFGLADDRPDMGYMRMPTEIPGHYQQGDYTLFRDIFRGQLDGQPDIFHYQTLSSNSSFVVAKNHEVVTFPKKQDRFSFVFSTGPDNYISKWEVTDANGFVHEYGAVEMTGTNAKPGVGPSGDPIHVPDNADLNKYPSSWYLTKIKSPTTSSEITFEYEDYATTYDMNVSETIAVGFPVNKAGNEVKLWGKRLKKIVFAEGEVVFNVHANNRCDIPGDRALSSIQLKDKAGQVVKTVSFSYAYFDQFGESPFSGCTTVDLNRRLKLKSVNLDAQAAGSKPYVFEYEEAYRLPGRLSANQDVYGYFNGASNNTLVPAMKVQYTIDNSKSILNLAGANRSHSENHAKAAVMKRVKLPTGGAVEFAYEGHTVDSELLPGNIVHKSETLTKTENSKNITMQQSFYPDNFISVSFLPDMTLECHIRVIIRNASNQIVYQRLFNDGDPLGLGYSDETFLPPGTYNVSFDYQSPIYSPGQCANLVEFVSINIAWQEEQGVGSKKTSGIRVSSMKHYDKDNTLVLSKHYRYGDAEGQSYGVLNHVPHFGYFMQRHIGTNQYLPIYIRTSNNVANNTAGNHVNYRKVEILTRENGEQGKEVLHFVSAGLVSDSYTGIAVESNSSSYVDLTSMSSDNLSRAIHYSTSDAKALSYPYTPKLSREHMRGGVILHEYFRQGQTVGTFIPVREKVSTYSYFDENPNIIHPVITQHPFVTQSPLVRGVVTSPIDYNPPGGTETFYVKHYLHSSSYNLLDGDVTREFGTDSGTQTLAVSNAYTYNSRAALSERETVNSDGKVVRQVYRYPYDNIPGLPAGEIQGKNMLVSKNQVSSPILEEHFSGAAKILENRYSYKVWHSSFSNVNKVYRSNSNFSSPNLVFTAEDYSPEGDLVTFSSENSEFTKAIYEGGRPVAFSANTKTNQIACFTSFETAEKGGWVYSGNPVVSAISKTGRKYYNLGTGNITKTSVGGSSNNPYKLTFWARRASGTGSWSFMGQTEILDTNWKLVERTVTGSSITISGSGIYVDELRLHPAGAQMESYTYDPLVGVTSKTDGGNRTLYYTYDNMGRLSMVRNSLGQIVELYDYNYATGN